MRGDLSSDLLASARILAEQYSVDLSILSKLLYLDCNLLADAAAKQNWQLGIKETSSFRSPEFGFEEGVSQVNSLAAQISRLLQWQLNCIESEGKSEAFSEVKTKSLLSITKALQTLEDMITRMEAALERVGQFPTDILEFRKKLEKQMEILSR